MLLRDYLDLAQIIVSIALVLAIVLQSKAGLGGLTGGDTGGVFRARRGVEKTLFNLTIVLSVVFFLIAMINVMFAR